MNTHNMFFSGENYQPSEITQILEQVQQVVKVSDNKV